MSDNKFEIDVQAFAKALQSGQSINGKNGSTRKTVKTSSGQFELDTPRDRNDSFEPQTVKKYQTRLTDEMERKVLSLFALGNRYQNIREHLLDLYGMEISSGTLNSITDRLIPELKAWQERDLEPVYPFVWLNAIPYKVKD
jgi:transposase-like protein